MRQTRRPLRHSLTILNSNNNLFPSWTRHFFPLWNETIPFPLPFSQPISASSKLHLKPSASPETATECWIWFKKKGKNYQLTLQREEKWGKRWKIMWTEQVGFRIPLFSLLVSFSSCASGDVKTQREGNLPVSSATVTERYALIHRVFVTTR